MIFIPYSTEVLIKKWPVSNIVFIGACVLFFILMVVSVVGESSLDWIEYMVLQGWSPVGLVGYQFLHGGFWHLFFNMMFLWVFGNAVCEKIGNLAYAGVFLVTGVLAGVLHILMSDSPAVGASGAINGIIGFYLVLYPVNRINCFYWIMFRLGTVDISGFWLILSWFVLDAWHAFSGARTGTAYWAHVGGFVAGVSLGFAFVKAGWAGMEFYDNPTLVDYLQGRKKAESQLEFERKPLSRTAAQQLTPPVKRTQQAPSVLKRRPLTPPPAQAPAPIPAPSPAPEPAAADVSAPVQGDINLDCPHCAQNMDVPPEMIGVEFKCPACNGSILIEV